jgi:hypothetical protein
MLRQLRENTESGRRRRRALWAALALLYAVPLAWLAYDRVQQVTYQKREQIIVQHRLWELHPEYSGSPRTWTRIASRLLTDRQILWRVRARYGGELARQIELEYRSDLTIAQLEAAAGVAAMWALPLAALYGLGRLLARRRAPAPPPQPAAPASIHDPRYLP